MTGVDRRDLTWARRAPCGAPRRVVLRLLAVAFSVALVVGACQSATAPNAPLPNVSGSYVLDEIDGHQLPYLSEKEPDGARRSLAGGDLYLRADSSYQWTLSWQYNYNGNDTTFGGNDSTVSAGRYSVREGVVVLHDSLSNVSLKATLGVHDTLRVAFQGHRYAFEKLPPLSPEGAAWSFGLCQDSLGERAYCPLETDSAGAMIREVQGGLYVGSDSMVWAVATPDSVAYVGANRYGWIHVWERYDANGDSTTVERVEFGNYTWDGATFKTQPADSAAFAPSTGSMPSRSGLLLRQRNQTLIFFEVPGTFSSQLSPAVAAGQRTFVAVP